MSGATGRFADYAWAWPKDGHDQLLQTAVLPDLERAAAAFRSWMETHDFEDITFREQRLLVAVSTRLPARLVTVDERARLTGVERMLWSRSRMALHAAKPALAALEAAGIEVMAFKGAARSALDMADLRGRIANDVDILVHMEDFVRSLDLLATAGWSSGKGRRINPRTITGINLEQGKHGRVDLHKYAFHQLVPDDAIDRTIWARAVAGSLVGHAVRVPSPTDRLVLAIGHGGIDAHNHSDWMVDCALLIRSGEVDWALFEDIIAVRGLSAYAAVALSYLSDRLEVDMPPAALERIAAAGRRSVLRKWGALLQSRPKFEHTNTTNLLRGIARGARQVRRAIALATVERRRARAVRQLKPGS